MALFTRDFLDRIQQSYTEDGEADILDILMNDDGLSFHDAIVLMAKWKSMQPEYLKEGNEPHPSLKNVSPTEQSDLY
jgi:hypothetical protein